MLVQLDAANSQRTKMKPITVTVSVRDKKAEMKFRLSTLAFLSTLSLSLSWFN